MQSSEVLTELRLPLTPHAETNLIQTVIMKATGAIRVFDVDYTLISRLDAFFGLCLHLIAQRKLYPCLLLPMDPLTQYVPGGLHLLLSNEDALPANDPTRCGSCAEVMSLPIALYPCEHLICTTCLERGLSSDFCELRCPVCQKGVILALVDAERLDAIQSQAIVTCPYAIDSGRCNFLNTLFSLYNSHLFVCPHKRPPRPEARSRLLTSLARSSDLHLSENSTIQPYSAILSLIRESVHDQLPLDRHSPRVEERSEVEHPSDDFTDTFGDKILQVCLHTKTDQDYILNGVNETNESLTQIKYFLGELTGTMSRFLRGKSLCSSCKQMYVDSSTGATTELQSASHLSTASEVTSFDASRMHGPEVCRNLMNRIDVLEGELREKTDQLRVLQERLTEYEEREKRLRLDRSEKVPEDVDRSQHQLPSLLVDDTLPNLGELTTVLEDANLSSDKLAHIRTELMRREATVVGMIREAENKYDALQRSLAELQKSNIIHISESRKLTEKNRVLTDQLSRLQGERDSLYTQLEVGSGLSSEAFRKQYLEYQALKDKLGRIAREYSALAEGMNSPVDTPSKHSTVTSALPEITTISLIRYILNPTPVPDSSVPFAIFANECRRRVKVGVNFAEDKEKRLRSFMELFGMLRRFYMTDFTRIRIDDFLAGFEVTGTPSGESYGVSARLDLLRQIEGLNHENAELRHALGDVASRRMLEQEA
ncbi:hypothetical protein GMRT_12113 [Giardia muris]|uniref:RING-type domain-containing protein n=1 Tax=Giardia muris TaxID=5742 RepID=A0A4Z1T1S0_GIAMU|nr:hypothetical protein GMRT_12113 [Giardia muris]|eukprot:TNJ26907.1 hypothetical protein GMRT_12113 [Giardia muris]